MPVEVEGMRKALREMEKLGVDVEDMKDVFSGIATEAARVMEGLAPSKSGALRASIRGNRAKNKAVVRIGKARVPYAGPINYGWPKRNIRPANFTARTDAVMEEKAEDMLLDGIEGLIKRFETGD
ncbi:hypothetical protein [Demequina oxidasica]|uniref:hypothetical protein n=1 Tax=Demequina oxidasica TaxID=676199 RepID=UPI000784AF36|nr:hypothetical protein [Demequina oxidasica]